METLKLPRVQVGTIKGVLQLEDANGRFARGTEAQGCSRWGTGQQHEEQKYNVQRRGITIEQLKNIRNSEEVRKREL